jgi:group I intron endonuclease
MFLLLYIQTLCRSMAFEIQREAKTIQLDLPDPTSYIYTFLCFSTGKGYVGQTKDPERRIQEHLEGKGSPHLLRALVDYGLNDFNIQIIDMICSDDEEVILALEDSWIRKCNSLHPLGFNLKLNAEIVPNNDFVDISNINISAKYIFSANGKCVFTVGQFTLSRNYQLLTNLIAEHKSTSLIHKKMEEFKYIQLCLSTANDQEYVKDEIYALNLRYNPQTDSLHLLL